MSDFVTKTKKIILLLGDLAALYLALYLTVLARYGHQEIAGRWEKHLVPFTLIFILWLVVFFINDFYDLKISYNSSNLMNALVRFSVINAIVAVLIFYFFAPFLDSIKPQRVLIIDLIFSLVLLFGWRRIFYNFIKSENIINKVLVIGPAVNNEALDLVEAINRRPQLGYQATFIPQMPDDIKGYCVRNHINILISAENLKSDQVVGQKLFYCLSLGIDVYNINSFYEQITNKIPVEYIDHSWFLENLAEHSKKLYEITKRFIDIFLAIIGLVITLPLVPLIALIIKLDNPGPIIFKQIRVGKNGKKFLAMKFRSMVADAEKNGAKWAQKNDPRVTRFGRLMRKTRLDEIPQLINIFRGEMSFVGPRPERPEFVDILAEKIPFYKERLLAKPGLTGWAQLNGPAYGGSQEESLEKLKYDLFYIKNRSWLLDIAILLKTIKVVLGGHGQ